MEEFKQYAIRVADRYMELSDADKESLRKMRDTKGGKLLASVLGPEMEPLFNQLAAPKKKGLGSPK